MDRIQPRRSIRRATPALCFVMLASALALPSVAHAAFPGANGKIVFSSVRDDPNAGSCPPQWSTTCNSEIYTVNPDGSGLARLTTNTQADRHPAWSADGQKIAFDRWNPATGKRDVYKMNADGSGQTMLIADAFNPAWSPDGTELVVGRNLPPSETDAFTGRTIIIDAVNGSEVSSDLTLGCIDFQWSPDGWYIAASCEHTQFTQQGYGIFVGGAQLNGFEPNELFLYTYPSWSPDGTRIAYDADDPSDPGIHVFNPDGTNDVLLREDFDASHPAWSPDKAKIAFKGAHSFGAGNIMVMNADGTAVANVTTGGLDSDPDWQPLDALKPYPRPGGAAPLLVWLVPAYEPCTSPNSSHVAPLSAGSCEPPTQVSDLLTTSKVGQGKGSVRLDTVVGNPSTPADEADVRLAVEISDVRNASDQSDYSGSVVLSSTIRTTDRAAGFGGVSGTRTDVRLDIPLSCVPTAAAPRGSDCGLTTTLDALVPAMIPEGKRSILATPTFSLLDSGLDGDISASACPPTCGTGDEEIFLEQGTFTP